MNTDPTPPRKPTVKLTTRQQFQLLDWLRNHEPEVKEKTDTQLAKLAGAELNFDITISNFTHAREAAGITKNTPPAPPTLEERVSQLENLFAAHFPLTSPPLPAVATALQAGLPLLPGLAGTGGIGANGANPAPES